MIADEADMTMTNDKYEEKKDNQLKKIGNLRREKGKI